MKHPHASVIKQWLEDTTQEIETMLLSPTEFERISIDELINDSEGTLYVRIKPKPDEYEHLRQAIRDGKKIELKTSIGWEIQPSPTFSFTVDRYRIHDQYRELKEAQEQGKRVVFKH